MPDHTAKPGRRRPPRRHFLRHGLTAGALIALDIPLAHSAAVLAVRVWPSPDYTRVTLELDQALKFTQSLVTDPPRLVVDLAGIDVDVTLRELLAKVQADDPYIRQVRVGQFQPGVMRLVFDLKSAVAPQLFTLAPVGQYRHRLVIDLYPVTPVDPLAELLAQARQRETGPRSGAPSDPISGLINGPRRPEAAAADKGVANRAASDKGTPDKGTPDKAASDKTASDRSGSDKSGPDKVGSRPAERGGSAPASAAPTGNATGAGPSNTGARAGNAPRGGPATTRLVTIAIDPGHGGEDPGAIGRRGTREKDVVLAVGRRLRDRINAEPNMRAFLTRDGDYFVPLSVRVSKARRVDADLFISIHADAFVRPDARGASVFVLSEHGASSTAARWLARKENNADLIGGIKLGRRNQELAKLLLDMSTTAQINDSSQLGRYVLAELGGLGALHKRDIEQAGFAVLKAPDIPSILVETAFISNPHEEQRLADGRHQADLAEAIFKGIRGYFVRHPVGPKTRST